MQMSGRERRFQSNSVIRVAFVAVSFLVQVGWIVLRVQWLNDYSVSNPVKTEILSE